MRAPGSYAGLSVKQAELLSFLRCCQADRKPQPTYHEMREHIDVVSLSTIARAIVALEDRGYISRTLTSPPKITCLERPVKRSEVDRDVIRSQLAPFTLSQLIDEIGARGLTVMAA